MLNEFANEIRIESSTLTLDDCFRSFTTSDELGAPDQMWCPSCRQLVPGEKKIDIWELPNVLVIQLKRFIVDISQTRKLEFRVDFPDVMDLSQFVRGKRNDRNQFGLYAICDHLGSTLTSGHYIAHICMDDQGRSVWYEFNDSTVTQKTADQVKSEKAYVLFYKRI
jgi:ubiquitin C-terminal hydrolase